MDGKTISLSLRNSMHLMEEIMLKFPCPAQVLRTLYISSHRLQTGVPSRGMNYSIKVS